MHDRHNAAILVLSIVAAACCLWVAAHGAVPMVRVAAAILFSFVGNTLFALVHEAVHGNFNREARRNAIGGTVAAAFFPTSFTLQRAFHLTHHRNNRSEIERFDCIGPGENVPLKTAQWFTILTGLYWLSAPVFGLVFALFGGLVPWRRLAASDSGFARQTSAGAFLGSIEAAPLWRVRGDVALALAVQAGLFVVLDLSWTAWALCYGAFAVNWSSLQYADHAFTRFDRLEGARNLRVHAVTRRFFLNYHDHLAHHRDPRRRWQSLPGHVVSADGSTPFLQVLYRMWQGPGIAAADPARVRQRDRVAVAAHTLVFALLFLLLYGSASGEYARLTVRLDVSMPIDAAIPFVPGFGLVYVSLTALLLLVPIMLATPARTLPFLAALSAELVVAWLCFQLLPVALPVVPAVDPASFGGMMFALADTSNLEGNGLPSLHVAFALSCAWVLNDRLPGWARVPLWLWVLAICASTMLLKQHYAVDAIAGGLLAVMTMGALHPWLVRALSTASETLISQRESFA